MKKLTFSFPCHLLSGLALVAASCAASADDFTVVHLPQANVDAPVSYNGYITNTVFADPALAHNPVSGVVNNTTFTPVPTPPLNLGVFDIIILPGPGLAANLPALAAFNRAAAAWEARMSDPITITINADLASLGPGILGSTSSVSLTAGYNTIRNGLVADAAGHTTDSIIASLPTAAQFAASVPAGVSLNGNLVATKASLKAIGGFGDLDAAFPGGDANITFSTNFSFDFDRSNGVGGGTFDFESVAQHEIGHALGFTSTVDSIDGGATSIAPTTLDLYRFARNTANDPASLANFTTFARNYVYGADTITDDITNAYRMSTGVSHGDGNQASHWKADDLTGAYIGIMDPTLAPGVFELATDADFRAFDLIGYDVVPEPSAFAALLGGIGLIGIRRARRR